MGGHDQIASFFDAGLERFQFKIKDLFIGLIDAGQAIVGIGRGIAMAREVFQGG